MIKLGRVQFLCGTLVLVLLIFRSATASADTIVYNLTALNAAGYTGPFIRVTVDRPNNTTADVTFESLTNGGFIYLMGDGASAALNVNASNFSVSTPVETNSLAGFTPTLKTNPNANSWRGSGNVDGWGNFNLTITNLDGFKDSATQIAFQLTNNSGTWLDAGSVLTGNNHNPGEIAAAHIFLCAVTGCNADSGAQSTLFASEAVPETVPEPGSLLLMQTGLLAGIAFWRKKIFS